MNRLKALLPILIGAVFAFAFFGCGSDEAPETETPKPDTEPVVKPAPKPDSEPSDPPAAAPDPKPDPAPEAEPKNGDAKPKPEADPEPEPEPEDSTTEASEDEPEVDSVANEAILLSGIRQLTFAGKRAGEGYFSADGKKMIFQSEREEDNPFYQIYLLDLETGDIDRVSPGHGKTTCSWIHPNGKKVLFASTQDDPDALDEQQDEFDQRASGTQRRYSWDYDEFYEIQEYDLETKTYTNLTNALGYDAEGAYSPDGSKVVFGSNRLGFSNPEALSEEDRSWFKLNPSFLMDIFIMNADGTDVKQLTDEPGYDGGPFFNHDGSKVCWRRFNRDGTQAEVYTMNADGSDQQQMTTLGAMSWAPYFHKSGEYLIFATNLQGFANFELYLVDSAGEKEPVRVTWTDGFDGLPCFSPDGKSLAWTTNRTAEKKSQIYIADWNHEAALDALGKSAPRSEPVSPGASTRARPEPTEVAGIRDSVPEITVEDLRAHIEYLASDALTGRMTGTEGEKMATAYVAKAFETWGLSPYDENPSSLSYFDEFTFTAGVDLGDKNSLTLKIGDESRELKIDEDWRPLSFSHLGEIDASEIVFAGYGLELPEGQGGEGGVEGMPYTSYYHTDCQDKWVMMFRFVPEDVEGDDRRKFMRFASLRYKAITARQKGAKGVIFVSGPNSKAKEELVELTFDASLADSGIAAISITSEIAEQLLGLAGENLAEIQTSLDTGEMMVGLPIEGASINVKIDIKQQKARGRNVIGRLKSKNPEASKRPAVIVGAHIDHLGNKPNSASRALDRERYEIHHGADDNASGTAGMMEIAQYLADLQATGKLKLERDVIFAAWSGEELGLLGSAEYVREVAEKLKNDGDAQLTDVFAANLNMDMIGRLDKTVVLQGIGSSSIWPGVIERRNAPIGLPVTIQSDTYLSTDATTFYLRGVPILSAFTGSHEDYHKPTDTADKVNYEGAQKITRFMGLVARGLAADPITPDYLTVERPENQGRRANLRAYLGTIPDYAQGDIVGVKLSGVGKGGPAEKSGVKGGDVVISLGGKDVKNIYDYTYILEALKIDEEVEIIILRKDEKIELKITPTSRD
ncbi:MAG: Tol biopolymer transport system component [Verrucomicrobiales bacterium]|jgi:Tol biopolymer transport system component